MNHEEFGVNQSHPYVYPTGEYYINVTWNDDTLGIDSEIRIQFHLFYLPGWVIASYSREWWIGPNNSVKW